MNKALLRVQHPGPTVEELVAEVANAKVFSKCDVRNGFWHVELDDDSSRLTTFLHRSGATVGSGCLLE